MILGNIAMFIYIILRTLWLELICFLLVYVSRKSTKNLNRAGEANIVRTYVLLVMSQCAKNNQRTISNETVETRAYDQCWT